MLTFRRLAVPCVLLLGLAACGSKTGATSICNQIPPPAACQQACDPSPGAQTACPAGYHCSPDGKCDAQCTVNGNQCGDDYVCTTDGYCMGTGSGSQVLPDADCPAVHFSATKTTPSIELLLDRSGSMSGTDISPNRYDALHTALTGSMGAITAAQADAYFGAALYTSDSTEVCPPDANLDGFAVPRALNNASAIDALISANGPGGNTPTAEWITAIAADFTAHPPPAGSPPIILLATDGAPNGCDGNSGNGPSIAAAQAAYTQGVRLFIIGLAGLNTNFLQQMANAGTGVMAGQPDAPYYTANDPASLVSAFNQIINGVLSCDLTLSGTVDASQASGGSVTLNGTPLNYGTDWTLDPNGMIIHLIGSACDTLKSSSNPMVDASFPCGAVIQ